MIGLGRLMSLHAAAALVGGVSVIRIDEQGVDLISPNRFYREPDEQDLRLHEERLARRRAAIAEQEAAERRKARVGKVHANAREIARRQRQQARQLAKAQG